MRAQTHFALLLLALLLPWGIAAQAPLSYGGPTDFGIYNSPIPAIPAAGGTFADPDFGGVSLRMTQAGSCGFADGTGFAPNAGAGWERAWSLDDSKLLLQSDPGGAWYYVNTGLPVANIKTATLGTCVAITALESYPEFAWTVANRIYGLATDGHSLAYWDSVVGHPAVTAGDYAAVSGLTLHAGSPYLIEGDHNDAWFCTVNGPQDSAQTPAEIGCLNRLTGNTQVFNYTAATEQQNAATPVALDNLSGAQTAGCTIHSIAWTLDAAWLYISTNNCTAFPGGYSSPKVFWQVGTNHVVWLPSAYASGHDALGWSGRFVNGNGTLSAVCGTPADSRWFLGWNLAAVGAGQTNWVAYSACPTPAIDYQLDSHMSWSNNQSGANANRYPVIVYFNNTSALSPNTGHANEWEIDALQTGAGETAIAGANYNTVQAGVIWRLAHTYNEPVGRQCPSMAWLSPNVSPDGRYVAYPSSMQGQTGTGINGDCNGTPPRRLDTFVLDATTSARGLPHPTTGVRP